jgi:hypothetical protein
MWGRYITCDEPPPFAGGKEHVLAQTTRPKRCGSSRWGRAIGAWLDGDRGWLARLLAAPASVILEIETSARPSASE